MVADQDGVIEPGEKVYLFFGMRRGGDFYYGLDVSNPDDPRVMWRLPNTGLQDLPANGQSWSKPIPARINIQGAGQNTDKLVLVFGGGYDTGHDDYNLTGTDSIGNAVYIVDSESGNVLWHGAKTGGNANFAKMDYSIPGDVRVVDLNGDGFSDRMYAADMGGQVWRFDIFNGQSTAGLVTGGVIARLGGAPLASPPLTDTRRFYYAPDIALVGGDVPFIHVGIGSGHRAHPNSVFNQDRFYALRDYTTFATHNQAYYDTLTPIVDGDLVDITTDPDADIPAGSAGWRLELRDGGWRGEKVLAEARTFNNQVFFTTFTPGAGAGGNTSNCEPVLGTNRLYIMSLFNGAPVNNLDESADEENLTESDRYIEFTGSIPSEVVFIFPSPEDPQNCVGEECAPPPVACVDLFCMPTGFGNDPVRTFWSEENTQ
jgi:type IV pilus assembly protein PilY1